MTLQGCSPESGQSNSRSNPFEMNWKTSRSCMDTKSQRHSSLFWTVSEQGVCLFPIISNTAPSQCSNCFQTLSQIHCHSKKKKKKKEAASKKETLYQRRYSKTSWQKKKANAFEGRHAAISFTAKVNLEKSRNTIKPWQRRDTEVSFMTFSSIRLGTELYSVKFIKYFFTTMWKKFQVKIFYVLFNRYGNLVLSLIEAIPFCKQTWVLSRTNKQNWDI